MTLENNELTEEKNRKITKITMFSGIAFYIVGIIVLVFYLFTDKQSDGQKSGVQTDIAIVKEFFPGLEGSESVCWENSNLQNSTSRVPGPTDSSYKGYIVLDEVVVAGYMKDYEWQEVNLILTAEYIDVSDYQDCTWYYCDEFNKSVMSGTMMGKIYFNGSIMWFEVSEF